MRPIRNIVVAFILVVAFIGCRQNRPEAGLPSSVFDGLLPRVVSNDRGFWFLVTDGGTKFQPFVSIGEGAQREVFYAIPKGARTLRLMPVTPFAYGSLDAQRDQRVVVDWLATPADGGADLPDSVGWTDAVTGTPSWAGKPLGDGTPVVLVTGAPPVDLDFANWLVGTASMKGGKLVDVHIDEGTSGPLALLPDGARPSRPIRAVLVGVSADSADGVEFASATVSIPDAPAGRFTTRPAALRAGVDALVSAGWGDTADVTLARPVLRNGLALAVTDEPLNVAQGDTTEALLAIRDIANGRDLVAAKALISVGVWSDRSRTAGKMRVLELVAAAGYVDWMRQSLMAEARGLGGDAALYLARAHFVGGDFERAADFAARAQERFVGWSVSAGNHGTARALALRARLSASSGDWDTAFSQSIDAAKKFEACNDAMRAAEQELIAATYAMNASDPVRAVKAAALARSRFFHGNSAYHAGFAEIALADIYLRSGEAGEAEKMLEFATLRFEELGDDVGRNRAHIAGGRVASARSRAQAVRGLEIGLEKAQKAGDFVGVVDAASSLVVLGGVPENAAASYGLVIAAGLARTADPYVRERAAQALTLLCGRGMAESVDQVGGASARDIAIAKAACGRPPGESGGSEHMLGALVSQGWAAYLAGDLVEAGTVAKKVEGSISDTVRESVPRQGAEALMFAAVIAYGDDPSRADELLVKATRLLGDTVDPTKLASTYAEIADRQLARGQVWLAAALLRAAMATAGDQGQAALRRDFAMRRVEVLHGGGDYDGASAAIRDAEPVLETAGAASAPLLARLWIFQTDVQERLGRKADAAISAGKAAKSLGETDALPRVELTLFAAELAAGRGDVTTATKEITRAETLEASLPEGLAAGDARKLLRARIQIVRGNTEAAQGDMSGASNAYFDASEIVAPLASSEPVLRARIAALAGLGNVTSSDAVLADVVHQLEQIRGSAAKVPTLAPYATGALAILEISSGRPSRALEVVSATALDGAVASENPLEALCVEARAAALSGSSDGPVKLARCAALATGEAKVDALLLTELTNPKVDAASKNRTARQLLVGEGARSGTRQQERLKLVSELGGGTVTRDERRDARLRAALNKARGKDNASRTTAAVEALTSYLFDTAQLSAASRVIEDNTTAILGVGPSGPGVLARLRVTAAVTGLDSVEAASFAARAVVETPDLDAEDQAGLLLQAARNAAVLGMWQHARSLATQALAAAKKSRNRKLQRRIQGFASRFSLALS